MQIQQNYNYAPNFQSRNETKIFGEFLNHPKIQGEMVDRFAKNNLYKEFCGKYKTRATLDASKPGSTCIASFDVDYKPVKKGLKRIFSFVTPYKNLHFSGY